METTINSPAISSYALYKASRFAKAAWEFHMWNPETAQTPEEDERDTELCNAFSTALTEYLLFPADSLKDLECKLRTHHEEAIWDGWDCAEEISAALAADARRLITEVEV